MTNEWIGLVDEIHPSDEMFLFFVERGYVKEEATAAYLESGRQMLNDFVSIAKSLDIKISDRTQILEFACGYGRFTRHLLSMVSPTQLTVADVYEDAVDFQRERFGVNGFYSSSSVENIIIPDAYDVIFVGSLFSHLPITIWSDMLRTLFSSLKKEGALIFSTHGPSCTNLTIPASGFLYLESSESKSLTGDVYGTTYVTTDFVNAAVSKITDRPIKLFRHKGLYAYQDVYAVVNGDVGVDAISYSIDLIDSEYIYGWAVYKPNPTFKLAVEIKSGRRVVAKGEANNFRQDLAIAHIGDGFCSFKLPITNRISKYEPLVLKVFDHNFVVTV